MRTNDFLPHIHVLPEDDANRQLAKAVKTSEMSGRGSTVEIETADEE